MRTLPILAADGTPVVLDATHSVQQRGELSASSKVRSEFAPVLERAAVAVEVCIETHPDRDRAPSDGSNVVTLRDFEPLVAEPMDTPDSPKRPR